jgi:hypothetical protein
MDEILHRAPYSRAGQPEPHRKVDLVLDAGAWSQVAGRDGRTEGIGDLLVQGHVGRTVDHDVYFCHDAPSDPTAT